MRPLYPGVRRHRGPAGSDQRQLHGDRPQNVQRRQCRHLAAPQQWQHHSSSQTQQQQPQPLPPPPPSASPRASVSAAAAAAAAGACANLGTNVLPPHLTTGGAGGFDTLHTHEQRQQQQRQHTSYAKAPPHPTLAGPGGASSCQAVRPYQCIWGEGGPCSSRTLTQARERAWRLRRPLRYL